MGSMMPYRNRAYDLYRKNFSEASAVGFLSAILFTVFSEGVKNLVDFGEKWMELTGIPYQMNIALLGFIVGYGTTRICLLMRMQLFKMLLAYQGWMFNPKSTTTKVCSLVYRSLNQSSVRLPSTSFSNEPHSVTLCIMHSVAVRKVCDTIVSCT